MVQVAAPSFGAQLRRYRREAGLTQEELAEQAGLSVRGISDLERDVKLRPHRDTLARLADALQLEGERRAALEAATRRSRQSPDGLAPDGGALLEATTDVHTVLIADVRGHTAFPLAHGDAAARLASIAQEVVATREGEVIERRGDEVLAVFSSSCQALWAAVELQERFGPCTWASGSMPEKPSRPRRAGIEGLL